MTRPRACTAAFWTDQNDWGPFSTLSPSARAPFAPRVRAPRPFALTRAAAVRLARDGERGSDQGRVRRVGLGLGLGRARGSLRGCRRARLRGRGGAAVSKLAGGAPGGRREDDDAERAPAPTKGARDAAPAAGARGRRAPRPRSRPIGFPPEDQSALARPRPLLRSRVSDPPLLRTPSASPARPLTHRPPTPPRPLPFLPPPLPPPSSPPARSLAHSLRNPGPPLHIERPLYPPLPSDSSAPSSPSSPTSPASSRAPSTPRRSTPPPTATSATTTSSAGAASPTRARASPPWSPTRGSCAGATARSSCWSGRRPWR